MEIIRLSVGVIAVNVYVYYDPVTKEGIVIDPGADANRVRDKMKRAGVTVTAIAATHGHWDHIGGVMDMFQHTGAFIYAAKAERMVLRNPALNGSLSMASRPIALMEYTPLEEGSVIQVGGASLRVLETPGHSCGSICLYDEANGVLFSGDTLFRESIGRTDFPTGDAEAIVASIRGKLYALPDDVKVYPGHGPVTTIGHEKMHNPYVPQLTL